MDNNIQQQIIKVWEYEQKILDVFSTICKENNLIYSLAYGTLLGAVRHKGFIPWDDDIDIIMPRQDYLKLLNIWDKVAPDNYILVNNQIYPDFTQSFTKIVMNNTTFLQSEFFAKVNYPKGIFIDIFPCDKVPANIIKRKMQFVANCVNMLYHRGYPSKEGGIIGFVEKLMLKFPHKLKKIMKMNTGLYVQKWNDCKNLQYISPVTFQGCKKLYPSNLFDDFEHIEFNGKKYCCSSAYREFLNICYGNYMELPPLEQRVWKHHPILINFEHSFEELSM